MGGGGCRPSSSSSNKCCVSAICTQFTHIRRTRQYTLLLRATSSCSQRPILQRLVREWWVTMGVSQEKSPVHIYSSYTMSHQMNRLGLSSTQPCGHRNGAGTTGHLTATHTHAYMTWLTIRVNTIYNTWERGVNTMRWYTYI